MFKKIILGVALAVLLISAIFYGCGKVVQEGATGGGGGGGTSNVAGVVRDVTTNVPLAGVTVSSVGGGSATTDIFGKFKLTNVPAGNNVVVKYVKAGYAYGQHNIMVSSALPADGSTYLKTVGTWGEFNSNSVINLSDPSSGALVNIPAGSLDFSGQVRVELTPFDPTKVNELQAFPGSFKAVVGGVESLIETFGFMTIVITKASDGSTVDLAPGKTIQEIRIPATANSPATCPLFYFDTAASTWKQIGTLTLVTSAQGNYYVGNNVAHTSYWNADMVDDTAYLIGTFLYIGTRAPVEGVRVIAIGKNYAGVSVDYSDKFGRFKVPVKANAYADVFYSSETYSGVFEQTVATPGPGETNDLGVRFFNSDGTYPFESKEMSVFFPNNITNRGSIALAMQRNAFLVNGSLAYVERNGSTWGNKEIITAQLSFQFAAQAAPDGSIKVCYIDAAGIEFAEKDSGGNWAISKIDTEPDIPYHSFALDSSGKPHAVYFARKDGETQYNLYYAVRNGTTWTITLLDVLNSDLALINAGVTGVSVATSLSGKIGVAYSCFDKNNIYGEHYLKYAEFDGTNWTLSTIKNLSGVGFTFWTASLAFSGDQPMIAAAVLSDSLRLYSRASGGVWSDQLVESSIPGEASMASILLPSLAVDNSGNPNIAYASFWQPSGSPVRYLLKYAYASNSIWKKYLVNSFGENEIPTTAITLRIGSDNKPKILWVSQGVVRLEEVQ